MPGKIIKFEPSVLAALDELAKQRDGTFEELADEAFYDLLKKYGRPTSFSDALKRSAKHPKEHLDGKQRTLRRQPAHRGRKKAHAA